MKPASTAHFRAYIKSVKHAAPGPDGLPYVAWDAPGHDGAQTLFEVNNFLASGYSMPMVFSDQLLLFDVKALRV